jgi:cell division protein FtsB
MSRNHKIVKPRFWLIIMSIFFICVMWAYNIQRDQMTHNAKKLADLEAQRLALLDEIAAIKNDIQYTTTDEYIIKEARDKYDLAFPNEIIYKSNN